MPRARRATTLAALVRALRNASRPGGPGLAELFRAAPRWISATLSGEYPGTSRGRLGALAAGLLYVLSPIDLLPEAVLPLIGLADDAFVVAWLAGQLLGETDAFVRWERERHAQRSTSGRGSRWAGFRTDRSGAQRPAGEQVVPGHVVR
jgi:uncharacterized membrane protein YkvA (DUF1232 family)